MINVKGEVEISDKQTVAVVGLGKIGLPLAVMYANHGFNVIGADINPDVVAKVNQGKSHLLNEPGVPELLEKAHKQKTIVATTRTKEAVEKASIVVVIVPVIVDDQNNVNFSYIDAAVEEIGKGLQKGTVVIFETTLPTGTTRNRFGTKLEEVSNLVMGTDFYLAYSPERVYSNRILQDLKSYPKVVGGINEVSLQKAVNFYQQSLQCDILEVSNTETAEFSKVAESVYRDVNIALSNELAVFADSLDVNISDVIKAGNSQPFCHLHQPGVTEKKVSEKTKAIFLETPTNPLMRETSIETIAKWAKERNLLLIVDNTFYTPVIQRPIEEGADIVLHSATKYLGGHNDVLAGLVVARGEELCERISQQQNAIGSVLSPFDSWLLLRGMKTLSLRMKKHEENAKKMAHFLSEHELITDVLYPGKGGMLSFRVKDEAFVDPFLRHLSVICFAESLGGVESFITYPATQTHGDIPEEIRTKNGVCNRLLRFSAGIEDVEDLKVDVSEALKKAESKVVKAYGR